MAAMITLQAANSYMAAYTAMNQHHGCNCNPSGEEQEEVNRCISSVRTLATTMDTASQQLLAGYLARKKLALDRMLAAYIKADGAPVGAPPELRDASPMCQQLLHMVAQAQSELSMYARCAQAMAHGMGLVSAAGVRDVCSSSNVAAQSAMCSFA